MALKSNGSGLALTRNRLTGLYDFSWDSSGNPTFDSTGEDLVLSLLCEFRGQYFGDETNGRRGSTLYLIKQDNSQTLSQILQAIDLALQLAVDDGRLRSFTRTATKRGTGRYSFTVNWVTPSGAKGTQPLALEI